MVTCSNMHNTLHFLRLVRLHSAAFLWPSSPSNEAEKSGQYAETGGNNQVTSLSRPKYYYLVITEWSTKALRCFRDGFRIPPRSITFVPQTLPPNRRTVARYTAARSTSAREFRCSLLATCRLYARQLRHRFEPFPRISRLQIASAHAAWSILLGGHAGQMLIGAFRRTTCPCLSLGP